MSRPSGCEERCRACPDRDLSYEESLRAKEDFVRRTLGEWSDVVEPIRGVGESGSWGYRSSVFLRARFSEERALWEAGLWIREPPRDGGKRWSEEVLPIPRCPAHRPELNLGLDRVFSLLGSRSLPIFGFLIRDRLLTLVLKAAFVSGVVEELRELDWASTGFAGVFLNHHPSAGDRVLSAKGWTHLWGAQAGTASRFGREFAHGPSSFSQQIAGLHEESIREAEEFFASGAPDFVADLYSGIGVSFARWADRGWPSVACEGSSEAAGFAGAYGEVLVGRVAERLPQIRERLMDRANVAVYANPSRLGLESEVVEWLEADSRVRSLAYLSCSAGTLSRDLRALTSAGWRVERVIPYDFLPRTRQVETLVLLHRQI